MTNEQQKIYEGLMAYREAHKQEQGFVAKELVSHMEPIFRENGFRRDMNPAARQHILVLRDDAAGDFVLSSAFLRELRRIYPAAHITLFASVRNKELAQCCPYIDNILLNDIESPGNDFWTMFPAVARYVVEQFVPYHFDLAFSGRLGVRSADVVLMYLSGANCRVAYTQDRPIAPGKIGTIGWNEMLSVAVPFVNKLQSDADRDIFMLEYLLKLPIADRHLEVWTLTEDADRAREAMAPLRQQGQMKRFYAVMPGASERFKEWPLERFEALLREIMRREPETGFFVLGGPGDRGKAEALAGSFPGRALSLAGRLPFRVSVEVLSSCQKYIGNDTGLMHMAAARRVPVLTLFPYPASLGLYIMSCPIRFQPYGTAAVAVLPPEQKDGDGRCSLASGTGCAENANGPHCILGVTVEKMLEGYELLEKCIREKRVHAMLLK